MSNEMRDWERDKIAEEQQIVAEYPFLRARDIDGTLDETQFPLMCLEIPEGWGKLFWQLCADIKPILEREKVMDSFYFIQVKEKYNRLECYNSGAPTEVQDIIDKYSVMASYVCTCCGKPATCETQGYFASYCNDCLKDHAIHEHIVWLEFKPYYKVTTFVKGNRLEKWISFEDEWNRYLKENGYED